MNTPFNRVALIVPTYNACERWTTWMQAFEEQKYKPYYLLNIDSSSIDGTVELSSKHGFDVKVITSEEFNHGATRQMGIENFPDADIVIFMTQDAILVNSHALENILKCFSDSKVGVAYGRQLPHITSGDISAHARLFNYSEKSKVKTMSDISKLGIKTAFISNSFAAYRREALMGIGGFPNNTILSEDTYVAAKMILDGWSVAYCADAQVYHSHDYTFIEEFKRYFDIGVFHAREPWIREKFGQAEGEGLKFVLSEAKYLLRSGKGYLLPSAFIRTCLKYLGYRLGTTEQKIPLNIKKQLSMHWRYWNQ